MRLKSKDDQPESGSHPLRTITSKRPVTEPREWFQLHLRLAVDTWGSIGSGVNFLLKKKLQLTVVIINHLWTRDIMEFAWDHQQKNPHC